MKKNSKGPQRDNPRARAAQLEQDWNRLLSRHSAPLERGARAFGLKVAKEIDPKKPSAVVTVKSTDSFSGMRGVAALAPQKVYTGDKILGIATMHKSNMVPIFNDEAAIEVAQMRRN
jgi:hypothetical protein